MTFKMLKSKLETKLTWPCMV